MVNQDIVTRVKSVLGSGTRRILVTGATGFVGHRLAATLTRAGHDVVATGRNRYLAPQETKFEPADIRDPEAIARLCRNCDIVIHSASNTSPWGAYRILAATNVKGTQNVIAGCLQHSVHRLVHVSSTSVQFDFRDAFDIVEDDGPPRKFACNYAKTKHVAEQVVRDACANGLNAFIIRARAVFGPGDQSLLPRLLEVYDQGRLKQIGDGKNVTDLTYVDNLVYAIVLAMEKGNAGATCTVTGGQSVPLWQLVRRILKSTNRNKPLGVVPYRVALGIASCSETAHQLLRLKKAPSLTRYAVGLLAKSQTFDTGAARQELDYEPIVSMDEGISRTIKSLTAKVESHSNVQVKIRLFTTGYTPISLHVAEYGGARKIVPFHAMFALIDHPEFGLTLFDTGYAPRFHDETSRWPYRAYSKITPVVTADQHSCVNVLRRASIDPNDVQRIVLSHFHADHVCGLKDFPNADVISTASAWRSVSGARGLSALRKAFLPGLMPSDLQDRLYLLPTFSDPGIGPFQHCHDLFSDGSVRLISLPGHAKGQIGALLQSGTATRTFLVADSVWTRRTVTDNLPLTFAFRMLADNAKDAKTTLGNLYKFHQQFPDVDLAPTHCQAVADEYGFNNGFDELSDGLV